MDNQQGPTVEHRELCSVLCGSLAGRGVWGRMDTRMGFQVVLVVKNLSADSGDVRDMGLIPGWGRVPGGGHGTSLQYFCPKIP